MATNQSHLLVKEVMVWWSDGLQWPHWPSRPIEWPTDHRPSTKKTSSSSLFLALTNNRLFPGIFSTISFISIISIIIIVQLLIIGRIFRQTHTHTSTLTQFSSVHTKHGIYLKLSNLSVCVCAFPLSVSLRWPPSPSSMDSIFKSNRKAEKIWLEGVRVSSQERQKKTKKLMKKKEPKESLKRNFKVNFCSKKKGIIKQKTKILEGKKKTTWWDHQRIKEIKEI